MKLSPKHLVPVMAAVAAIAFTSPAFAWNSAICNPTTGEILQGGGAPPLTTEAMYVAYLHDHPGSFELAPGQKCVKNSAPPTQVVPVTPVVPVPSSVPVTPVGPQPSVVATTLAPLVPVVEHDNRPVYCHDESTVGFATTRRSNDLYKDLARTGNSAMGANGLCAKPIAPVAAAVVAAPIAVAGVQAAAPPVPNAPAPVALAPVAPAPIAPAPVAPSAPPTIATPAAAEVAIVAPVSEQAVVPIVLDVSTFAAPAAGDGTQADELVP